MKLPKSSNGGLRVLVALYECKVKLMRYLVEAEADFMLANDANDNGGVILRNMVRAER